MESLLDTSLQVAELARQPFDFARTIQEAGWPALRPESIRTVQINVGKRCNQACRHCHVGAGPTRTEEMDTPTAEACLNVIEALTEAETVDLTGGAPELNPNFEKLVLGSRRLGKRVMDRCNLTVLEEHGGGRLYEFLAENEVEIIASLPHFAASRTDSQRGRGVFEKSIQALQKLNALGYGRETALRLHLVYNPTGTFLAAPQSELQRDYKKRLGETYGIFFNDLYCLNNMPISRFLGSLLHAGRLHEYMQTLANAFNPRTIAGLMCRNQISIGYDGRIYDCDFNQMLELEAQGGPIDRFDRDAFLMRTIVTANHCYGCTAGAGSSCGGELV